MAIKRIERYGRTYTYDGTKLINVSKKKKTEQSSMREKAAEKNKGKVYEAGKGLTDRGGTSKKYNLGISAYAKNKKDQETAAKQLDSLYEERYKIQQLDSKNTKAIKAVDNKIKKAEANYKTATNNFEAAKSKRYFDRQTTKYNNLSKDLNYTVHSAYKGKVTADNYWTHNEAAQLSAYINDPSVRKAMDTAALAGSNGTKDSAYPTLKYMNEDEKKNFNFLYNSRNDGGAAAKSYIDDYLSYALNERYYKEAEAEAEKFAKENPVGASAVSVPKSVFGGLGSLDVYGQKIQNAITGSDRPIDWNRPIMANTSGGATKIRETVAEGIENPALKFVYQIGMSMADSAASMPLGSWMGPAMLGGSAGAATMKEAKSNGATDDQALAMGGAAAAFELVFEKIGMDNLFNAKNAAQVDGWFKTILKQANVEGAEEVATSLGNAAADAIIMGDKSEYNRNVQSYMQQGYSKTEAEQLAMQDFAKNLAMDYVGGAFSGGVFGSGSMGINAVTKKISTPTLNKYAGTENIDNVLDREYETSFHQIESRLGEEVAKDVEATMRAANQNMQAENTSRKFAIVTNEKGQQYVKADRQVIKGTNPSAWAKAVEKYINNNIRQGKDVQFTAADGDVLTITRDTAGKAKFRNEVKMADGTKRLMTDSEFAAKLRAEAHVDELAQVSKRGKSNVADYKKHSFAKDGFNYRTAYFEDADGQLYRITMSVGINGDIKTIYNVGKMKSQKKKPSLVAQRPSGKLPQAENFSNTNISSNDISVNNNMPSFSKNDTIKETGGIANENILDGSSRRDTGERTGKQALRVGETAAEVESRLRDTERIEESGNASEVIDDSGSVEVRYNEIPESMLPAYCQEIKKMLNEYGIDTRFSLGAIRMTDENGVNHITNGFTEGNIVVLNAKAKRLNKYALHELFHYLAANNPEAYNKFKNDVINSAFGEGQFAAYNNKIRQLYQGISKNSNEIIEEVMANVFAGIYSVDNTAALAEAIDAFNEKANNTGKNKDIRFNITEEIPKKKRSSKSKADVDSLMESEPPAEQEKAYFQEIIQTERDKEREAFEAEIAKVDLPKKAQKFFDKKVKEFSKLAFDLMSTLNEDKAGMKADIRIFAEEILRTGKIDNAKLTEIAQRLWQGGVVIDKSFMNQHKELYDRIKDIKINVPQRVRNDIADYNDYRKSIIGLVKTGKDGRQIDDLYQELNSMDASLFPDDIINATDQFLRIVSVREMFKPVATKNAKITEMGYKDYAIREFARLTQEFYSGVMQAHEYRKIVLEGSEDIGYVDQKRNQEAAKHLSESLKAFAAWKKDNLIDEYSEEQARKIVYEDLAIDSLADQTLSGKKINKNLVEKAIPYIRNIKKYEDVTAAYKRQQKARAYAKAKMVTTNSDLWNDKKNGIQYMRETQERNIEDIAGKTDPEGAAMIKELYLDPVHANEAQKQEFMKMLQEKIGALNLTGAERLLTQAYGEGLITKQQLEEFAKSKNKIVIKTVKGDTVYEQGFVGKARNVDVSKVESAVSEFREVYDMLIDRANEVLVANGYARIDKLDNYFPHFSSDEGIWNTIKKVFFGTDMNIDAALPEDINGLTHVFRPGKKFFANFLHRKGSATGLDAYMGFDMYLAGIADVIFHTEDIQNWRALEVVLRNKHTDAETQKRIKDIWNSDLPYNERESQIAGILDAAETGNLSNYVVNLSEYIGVLAGKKSIFDRPSERAFNRRIYATMQAVEGRIASNMLGGNVGSWLTNFIPLVQMNAQVKSKYMLKAVKQTMSSWRNNDGFVSGSDFLINRRGNNPLSKDVFNKISDVAMKPMEYIDMFTTEVCCRAVYMEQIAKGKSHEDAMKIANARTAQVVADRSYGALPTIFNVRNPFAKLFTQFQVEVNNQFSNLFKDIPRRVKEEGAGFLIWALVKYFIGAALFNDLYEKLAGRRPAFDPIGMVKEAYKTYDASKDAGAVAKNVVSNAIEQVPFVGGFLGGGRVPVSSAIPFSGDLDSLTTAITSLASPDVAWEEKKEILNKEISKPVFYLFFPTAGGAVKKVIEGSKIVAQGGAYTYNKEGEKTVKYAVNQEPGDYMRNMIFGAWSSPEAQNYLLSGSKALGIKETQTFDALKELGMKPTEAFDVVKEISDIQGIPNVKGSKAKNRIEAIDDLDVSEDVKYQLYYDMVIPDSKKEDFDIATKEYGMSKTDLMTAYASTYGIKGDKDSDGKTVSGSKSEKVKAQIDSIDGLNSQQQEFMYDTFDVGKNARGMNEAEKAQMLENSVIPEAVNYDIPKYKAETMQKIQKIGVSANDYAYISDRISAYDDKVDYLKSFSFNESQLRGLVSEMVMGDTAQDKMLVAGEEYGIPENTYIDAYMYGYESTGSKAERNEKIFNYIQGLKLKEEQKTALYDYIKVYKSKDAGSDSGGKTSKRSSGGGGSSSRKKISVPSAPSVSVKKVSGASGNMWTAAYKNLADKQKRADYEAQLEAINNNVFMTAAQKASAKRRLAKQFNM